MIDTKRCTFCKRRKKFSEFHKHKPSKDGLKPRCKFCCVAAERARRKIPEHRSVSLWHDVNKRVKNQPEYAGVEVRVEKEAFIAWATAEYEAWIAAGRTERPSIDRIEASGHYEIGNIRMIPLGDNCRRPRKNHNVHAPEGTAWCSTCKGYKPSDQFEKNRTRFNGLQARCRSCRAEYRRLAKER